MKYIYVLKVEILKTKIGKPQSNNYSAWLSKKGVLHHYHIVQGDRLSRGYMLLNEGFCPHRKEDVRWDYLFCTVESKDKEECEQITIEVYKAGKGTR